MTAYERYRKKTLVRLNLTLNRNTDADILKWLGTTPNMAGSIKKAIREHIKYSNDPPGIVPDFGSGGDDD